MPEPFLKCGHASYSNPFFLGNFVETRPDCCNFFMSLSLEYHYLASSTSYPISEGTAPMVRKRFPQVGVCGYRILRSKFGGTNLVYTTAHQTSSATPGSFIPLPPFSCKSRYDSRFMFC